MRNLLWTVLLASSAAMPAMAQDDDRQRDDTEQTAPNEQRDESRAARRVERAERSPRPERVERERPEAADPVDHAVRAEARQQRAQERSSGEFIVPQAEVERPHGERRDRGRRSSDSEVMTDTAERQHSPSRDWGQGSSGEQLRQQRRDGRNRDRSVMERAVEQSRIRNGEVSVHRDRDRDRRSHNRQSGADRRWNNHWRSDRNYDWRNYRHHNRSVFRQGNYWDPYGSRYRHFSIGFSLFPSYYRSDYWLRDPWQYRLPPAYGPYRWIRYYNDALLVDIYSGQVIDVERNFFW